MPDGPACCGDDRGDEHHRGLSFPHSTWIDRTVSLMPGDRTVLQSNMTLHLMLAVYPDHVGDGRPERLSRIPRSLFVKE
jgi:ectoine hydrolase